MDVGGSMSATATQHDETRSWEVIRKHRVVFTGQMPVLPSLHGREEEWLSTEEALVLRGLCICLLATCFTTECGCIGWLCTNGFAV